jgi:hypothetical protein
MPNALMWWDNKNMLRDRVESYRDVTSTTFTTTGHVLGPLHFTGSDANYGVPKSPTALPGRARRRLAPVQRRGLVPSLPRYTDLSGCKQFGRAVCAICQQVN